MLYFVRSIGNTVHVYIIREGKGTHAHKTAIYTYTLHANDLIIHSGCTTLVLIVDRCCLAITNYHVFLWLFNTQLHFVTEYSSRAELLLWNLIL